MIASEAGAWSTFPQAADDAVEIGEPQQAENGDDDRLAEGGNAVGKIGDAPTEHCGFGEIVRSHVRYFHWLAECASGENSRNRQAV